ncbi:MAG: 4Fe-4S binding protein [Desulfovibrionaceae bacterium]|nr:4Fe-4S binding protein [Desulfovibrionaceae bacterium]
MLLFDPLAGLTVPLAARQFSFRPVIIVYLSALIFGRIFCGWLCPMGATLDLIRPLVAQRQKKNYTQKNYHLWRSTKYVIRFSAGKPTGLPVGGTAFNLPFFVL